MPSFALKICNLDKIASKIFSLFSSLFYAFLDCLCGVSSYFQWNRKRERRNFSLP